MSRFLCGSALLIATTRASETQVSQWRLEPVATIGGAEAVDPLTIFENVTAAGRGGVLQAQINRPPVEIVAAYGDDLVAVLDRDEADAQRVRINLIVSVR